MISIGGSPADANVAASHTHVCVTARAAFACYTKGGTLVGLGPGYSARPYTAKEFFEQAGLGPIVAVDGGSNYAKDGRVATQGWLQVSDVAAIDLARRFENMPLAALVYTDISRDGMLQGVNLAAMKEMTAATRLPVIASGGVTTLDDIRQLAAIPVAGCIVGRALYEGRLALKDILQAAQ